MLVRRLIVVDPEEVKEVLTSMCARLYGRAEPVKQDETIRTVDVVSFTSLNRTQVPGAHVKATADDPTSDPRAQEQEEPSTGATSPACSRSPRRSGTPRGACLDADHSCVSGAAPSTSACGPCAGCSRSDPDVDPWHLGA